MNVIEFDKVTKAYRLGDTSMSLISILKNGFGRMMRWDVGHEQPMFESLRGITFHVQQGETLGLIGNNGAGKSTVLKLIAQITYPTSGKVICRRRAASLIELSAGFHPDLSGRDNIYLRGAILGLKRREIAARFDEIVDFSGLAQFIDTPIKRYSSGMQARLAFSVVTHLHMELLLIDEVLSVGDIAFQRKCYDWIEHLRAQGTTIVYVSHDLRSVTTLCDRTILIDEGQIVADGASEDVLELYISRERDRQKAQLADHIIHSDDVIVITQIDLLNASRNLIREIHPGEALTVRIHYRVPNPLEMPRFAVRMRRSDGVLCFSVYSTHVSELPGALVDEGVIEVQTGTLPLLPDKYRVEVEVHDRHTPLVYVKHNDSPLTVLGTLRNNAYQGVFLPESTWTHRGTNNEETHHNGNIGPYDHARPIRRDC